MAEDINQSGPWEAYQSPQSSSTAEGPWSAYQEPQESGKSVSGFLSNAGTDIGNIASGVGSLAKGLATHPIDTATTLGKNIIPATYGEYKEAITHPIEHTYAHPVNTLLDVLPFATGAAKLGRATGLLGEGAEEAGMAAKAAKGAEEANLLEPAEIAEGATPALSPSASEMAAGPLSEVNPRVSASVPAEGSSSLGSVSPKDAFVKAQFDYDQNIAKFKELQQQAYNAGNGVEFDKIAEQNPYYQAAAKASDDLIANGKTLHESGMTNRELDKLRFELPKTQPTIPPVKTPIAKALTPAERVANSAFIQGLGSTPRQVLREIGMGSGKNLEQKVASLRSWAATADKGENAARLLDKTGEFAERMQDIHDTAGRVFGDILDKVGKESPTGEAIGLPAINKQAVISDLQNFAENTADTNTEASVNKLIKTAGKLEGKPTTDLRIVQQIKQMAGDQLKKDPNMARVYGYLSGKIDDVIDQYGKAINDPSMKAAYDAAKLNYANSSKILPMLGLAQAKSMVLPHGFIRNITEKMFELTTGNTPGQLYKNALLKGANNVGTISNVASRVPPAAAYAGLADYLTNQYQNRRPQQ